MTFLSFDVLLISPFQNARSFIVWNMLLKINQGIWHHTGGVLHYIFYILEKLHENGSLYDTKQTRVGRFSRAFNFYSCIFLNQMKWNVDLKQSSLLGVVNVV